MVSFVYPALAAYLARRYSVGLIQQTHIRGRALVRQNKTKNKESIEVHVKQFYNGTLGKVDHQTQYLRDYWMIKISHIGRW